MATAQRNLTETEENVMETLEAGGPMLIGKLEVIILIGSLNRIPFFQQCVKTFLAKDFVPLTKLYQNEYMAHHKLVIILLLL